MIHVKANCALVCILVAEVLQGIAITTQYWIQIDGRLADGGPEGTFDTSTTYNLGLFRLCYQVSGDSQTCRKYPTLDWTWWTAALTLNLVGFALLVSAGVLVVLSITVNRCKTRCFQLFTATTLVLTALLIAGGSGAIGAGLQELDVEGKIKVHASVYLSICCLALSLLSGILLFLSRPVNQYEEDRNHLWAGPRPGKPMASRGYAPRPSGVRPGTARQPFTSRSRRPSSQSRGRHPGTHRPGTHRPGTHRSGTHRPGTHHPGTHRPGTHHPGKHRPGTHQPPAPGTHRSSQMPPAGAYRSVVDGYQRHGPGTSRPYGSRAPRPGGVPSGMSHRSGVAAGYSRHGPGSRVPSLMGQKRIMVRGKSGATAQSRRH